MTEKKIRLRPFRTPALSGPEVTWWRPVLATILGLTLPAVIALLVVLAGGPVLSDPPSPGTATLSDHVALIIGLLMVSPFASWLALPLAAPMVRAAAMLGWAGYGTSMASAVVVGWPMAHVILNGDLTTEEKALPIHLAVSLCLIGLSVWAVFWGLMALRKQRVS